MNRRQILKNSLIGGLVSVIPFNNKIFGKEKIVLNNEEIIDCMFLELTKSQFYYLRVIDELEINNPAFVSFKIPSFEKREEIGYSVDIKNNEIENVQYACNLLRFGIDNWFICENINNLGFLIHSIKLNSDDTTISVDLYVCRIIPNGEINV